VGFLALFIIFSGEGDGFVYHPGLGEVFATYFCSVKFDVSVPYQGMYVLVDGGVKSIGRQHVLAPIPWDAIYY
jgi:hypothetical protein